MFIFQVICLTLIAFCSTAQLPSRNYLPSNLGAKGTSQESFIALSHQSSSNIGGYGDSNNRRPQQDVEKNAVVLKRDQDMSETGGENRFEICFCFNNLVSSCFCCAISLFILRKLEKTLSNIIMLLRSSIFQSNLFSRFPLLLRNLQRHTHYRNRQHSFHSGRILLYRRRWQDLHCDLHCWSRRFQTSRCSLASIAWRDG